MSGKGIRLSNEKEAAMATTCQGRLEVKSLKVNLRVFREFAWDEDLLDAQKFIPLENRKEKEARKHWGTTLLGFCEPYIEEETESSLIYGFHTQYTPALPVVKQMGVQFSALDFRYDYWEPQMAFIGYLVMNHGVVNEEFFEYKSCPFWLFKRLKVNWAHSRKVESGKGPKIENVPPYVIWDEAPDGILEGAEKS